MALSERVLDIATLGALGGLACIKRLAWQRAAADYHCRPGSWGFEQTTVQITLRGHGQCWPQGLSGMAQPVPVGMAMLYANRSHPQVVYAREGEQPWEFLYVNLIGAAAAASVRDLVALRGHVQPLAVGHGVVRAALDALPARAHEYQAWAVERSAALAQRLLLALLDGPSPLAVGPDDRLVGAAMALMGSDLGRHWDVAAVAQELDVTREHLTRVFAARVGAPPARWLRGQRIAAAARRLRGGEPVAAIARACGFADAAHFAEVFRRGTGLTPLAFRRRGGLPGW
jgi:AraC-like DNA-binding protein